MSQPASSSGSIAVTAGTTVIPAASRTSQLKSGVVQSVILNPGSATSSVQLYDGTSTAGTLLVSLVSPANGASVIWDSTDGVAYATDLFVVVAGTAATAIVHYTQGG